MAGRVSEPTGAVLLCGLMGAGKSSVGRALARRLDWTFIDTDARIEARAGQSVREIFETSGELAFRALEAQVLRDLPRERAVISLGGGAVATPANRAVVQQKGTLVWLDAPAEVLAQRVGDTAARPLLAGLDGAGLVERLRVLAAEREPAYREARHRIDAASGDVNAVCDALLRVLGC